MSFIVVIPARFFSTRFPGKPLARIKGQPMIIRVMEIALNSDAEKVVVATDHIDIFHVVKQTSSAAEVILTRMDHKSGTERIGEVVRGYKFMDHQVIVNLQGDEPLVSSNMVNQVASDLLKFNDISMSTLAIRMSSINIHDNRYNNNIVKVVVDRKSNALYFSRSMIPWCKNESLCISKEHINKNIFLRHIGIYAYRVNFLYRYVSWPVSPLERMESLEQLRVLWYGEKIHVSIIDSDMYYINIDTIEELNQVNLFLGE